MQLLKIKAYEVKDSRKEKTIQVVVITDKGKFYTSAPSGKSTGRHEVKSYKKDLHGDINFLNNFDVDKINRLDLKEFSDLTKVEKILAGKIGGNSLYVLEASLLKALAFENGLELFEFLGGRKIPRPVGNSIGGGLHSIGIKGKKPDFQEFLFIPGEKSFYDNVRINNFAYKLAGRFFGLFKKRNDESAWETNFQNGDVLAIMKTVRDHIRNKYNKKIDIGLDIAASSFYKYGKYVYKNNEKILTKKEQIAYISDIIRQYDLFYVEDPLEEDDFSGFAELRKKVSCLIVGDDLITTNPIRLKKAIKSKAVNAIIVKPNQIGSLIKMKEVIDLAKKNKIKTIISHRSGETIDDTIADLAVGFGVDFIKTGIYGKVRKTKLNKLIRIEKKLYKM